MKQTAILQLPLPIQINREAVNNHMVKNKFDQNDQSIVRRRKLVVVNQHFENQIVFKNLPVVLRKSSFKNSTIGDKFPERDISIYSDSIPN